jgi:hypothetical protein
LAIERGGSIGRIDRELKSPAKSRVTRSRRPRIIPNILVRPEVAAAAKRGLELREKFHGGGTSVGAHRGKPRMGRRGQPPAGYIAWLLWGGEPGRRWADGLKSYLGRTAAE